MPKKLQPTVDFMAFKCRTLRVKLSNGLSPPANGPKCYIDNNVAIDRASNARQVKGNDPDKGIPWSSSLGSGMGLTSPHKKYVLLRSF